MTNLVVVRRKSDGLYFTGARSNHARSRKGWVADLQQCLPYTNSRGVRGAFNPRNFDVLYDIIPVELQEAK